VGQNLPSLHRLRLKGRCRCDSHPPGEDALSATEAPGHNLVAIITGSGRGIGRAVASRLAADGMKVVVNDVGVDLMGIRNDGSVAEAVANDIRAEGGQAIANNDSVATMEGAEAMVSDALNAFGRLDVLVNNAGVMRDIDFLEMSEEDWEYVYGVNLKGVFACSRAAARSMAARGGGQIINMSSINAFGFSSMSDLVPHRANYAATKAGVLGLTWALAGELAEHRITCNAVLPTATTRLMTQARERRISAGIPTSERALVERDPDTVARLVAGLTSVECRDVTGQVLHIDGEHVSLYRRPVAGGSVHLAQMGSAEIGRAIRTAVEARPTCSEDRPS
jgi:NAD(P)-dependent dehydrogenase (short-subunit alcohol dehydrogenase family)